MNSLLHGRTEKFCFEAAERYLLGLRDPASGGFRFAEGQPPTLMASAQCVLGLELTGGLHRLSGDTRAKLTSFLMSSSEASGEFRDRLYSPSDVTSDRHDDSYFFEETTAHCQQALDALGAPPPPGRQWPAWRRADDLIEYFERLPWEDAWLESNRVMFVLSQLCHDVERHGKKQLLPWVDAVLDWLNSHQDPTTGLWQGPYPVSLSNAMAATFHFTFFYSYRRRELRYADRIIDSCLSLQEEDGLFSGSSVGHTCLDYDALDLLAKSSLAIQYRSTDVGRAMARARDALIGLHDEESGGFVHCRERLERPRPRSSVVRRLASRLRINGQLPQGRVPAYPSRVGGWQLLSCQASESNAMSTWFRLLALRLAEQPILVAGESPWWGAFRRLPFLGYHRAGCTQRGMGS